MHIKIHSLNKHTVRSNQGQLVSSELQHHVRRTHAHIENLPDAQQTSNIKSVTVTQSNPCNIYQNGVHQNLWVNVFFQPHRSQRAVRPTHSHIALLCSSNPLAHSCYVRPTHSHKAVLSVSNPSTQKCVVFVQPIHTKLCCLHPIHSDQAVLFSPNPLTQSCVVFAQLIHTKLCCSRLTHHTDTGVFV